MKVFCLKGFGMQHKTRCDRTYANCKSTCNKGQFTKSISPPLSQCISQWIYIENLIELQEKFFVAKFE